MTLLRFSFAILVTFPMLTQPAPAEETPMKVLYFTKSSGYEHSVVKRNGEALSHSERILSEFLGLHGVEVVCSKDGSMIQPENLARFDAVIFYTSGNLLETGTDGHPPISNKGLESLLEWIRNGGGFIGIHAATDSLRGETPTEYTQLIGAAFDQHGKQEPADVVVVDPDFPAVKGLPLEFRVVEEWYLHNQINASGSMRVLAALRTREMQQEMYNQHPMIPLVWCSEYGNGRVYYTALGHREDVWEMPVFQGSLLSALSWASGRKPGAAKPNFFEVFTAP